MRQRPRQRCVTARAEGARRQLSGLCSLVFLSGSLSSSSSPFPTKWGQRPEFLISRIFVSWASSGVIRSSCLSLRTQSTHLPLGLPLGLSPGTLMSTTVLTSLFSSIQCMCPYQLSVISLIFSLMLFTPSSFLMSTLFTLSLCGTPLILLNILISVFSWFTCTVITHNFSQFLLFSRIYNLSIKSMYFSASE